MVFFFYGFVVCYGVMRVVIWFLFFFFCYFFGNCVWLLLSFVWFEFCCWFFVLDFCFFVIRDVLILIWRIGCLFFFEGEMDRKKSVGWMLWVWGGLNLSDVWVDWSVVFGFGLFWLSEKVYILVVMWGEEICWWFDFFGCMLFLLCWMYIFCSEGCFYEML